MPTDMYDAYGPEQQITVGSVAKDLATSPFRMSTYAGLYTSWPGMWSIGKGVWIPYIGKNLEKGGMTAVATGAKSLFTNTMAQKGFWGKAQGFAGIGGRFLKETATLGHGGGGYYSGPGGWLNKKNLIPEAQQLYNKILPEVQQIYKSSGRFTEQQLKKKAWEMRQVAKKGVQAAAGGDVNFAIKLGGGLGTTINVKTPELAGKEIFRAGAARTAAKIGLGVAKGASYVGLAIMAWDIASIVGQPLGRAMVRGLENVANEYQRRFMPEVGGRLEMSYLSQGAATERQRAISAMSKAYINGRSAFGSEAEYLHKGY